MQRGDDQQDDFGSERSRSPIERIFPNDRFSCFLEVANSQLLSLLGAGTVRRLSTEVEVQAAEKEAGVSDGD
jgi:hypothetical protein